jgi:hypothetical protein
MLGEKLSGAHGRIYVHNSPGAVTVSFDILFIVGMITGMVGACAFPGSIWSGTFTTSSVFVGASIAAPVTYTAATRFVRRNGRYCGSF